MGNDHGVSPALDPRTSDPAQDSFWSALRITTNVVLALLLRDVRLRFAGTHLGYFWAMAEPIAAIFLLTVIFYMMGSPPLAGNSLALFFALGTLSYETYRRVSAQVGGALTANAALLSFPIVKEFDLLLARALLEFVLSILNLTLAIAILVVLEDIPMPVRIDQVAGGIVLLALLGFGMGCINATIEQYFASWRHIDSLMQRALFMMSGIFFTMNSMSPAVLDIISWNPILHGVEWIRFGFYQGYRADRISIEYLFVCGLVTSVVGLAGIRYLRRRDV